MSTSAIIGFGTLFQRGDGGSPETFTSIADVTNITPPAPKLDTVDVTDETSPDGYREFKGTLRDGGEASVDLNFRPGQSTHVQLKTDLDSGLPHNYKILFTDSPQTKLTFSAIVTELTPAAPLDGKVSLAVKLKISGKPTYAAA